MKLLRMSAIVLVLCGLVLRSSAGIKTDPGTAYARVSTGSTPTPTFSSNWTFCTWLKTTLVNPGVQYNLMDHQTFLGGSVQFYFYIQSSNGAVAFWNGSANVFAGTTNIANGNWHAYCGTRDGSNNWASYVDGVLDTSVNNAYTQAASGSNANNIGANSGTNFTCKCTYAETVWYQTVLTLNQIKAFAKGIPPSQIDALHYVGTSNGLYWPLYFTTGTSGNNASDLSGGKWNPAVANTAGSVTNTNHCPCSPPAGAESH